jgi:integrase
VTATKLTLSDLIDTWVRSQASQGLAKGTIRNRELHLRAFMALVGNIQLRSIERRHADAYFEHCRTKARPLQPSSLNAHKDSLDAFFKWTVIHRYLEADRNPMQGRRKFKVMPKDRLLIPASDFPRLLDSAPHPRDRIVVAMGLYLFPRQSEIRSTRIRDVDLERGYVRMWNHKSSSMDDMPVCEELDSEARRWLTFYSERVPLEANHYFVPAKLMVPVRGGPSPMQRRAAQLRGHAHAHSTDGGASRGRPADTGGCGLPDSWRGWQ